METVCPECKKPQVIPNEVWDRYYPEIPLCDDCLRDTIRSHVEDTDGDIFVRAKERAVTTGKTMLVVRNEYTRKLPDGEIHHPGLFIVQEDTLSEGERININNQIVAVIRAPRQGPS